MRRRVGMSWSGRGRLAVPASVRARRRLRYAGLVVLLCTVLTVSPMTGTAFAIPGDGMDRTSNAKVDLPELDKAVAVDRDTDEPTDLSRPADVPVEEYVPAHVTPWAAAADQTADLTGLAAGESVQVGTTPVKLGVPDGQDPAALAGTWQVDLASVDASTAANVPGVLMAVTPPAGVDPAASVAVEVDHSTFTDLFGTQAADRFRLTVLEGCSLPDTATLDCGGEGVSTMSVAGDEGSGPELVPVESEIEVDRTRAVTSSGAETKETKRRLTGVVPVSLLTVPDPASDGGTPITPDGDGAGAPEPGSSGPGDTEPQELRPSTSPSSASPSSASPSSASPSSVSRSSSGGANARHAAFAAAGQGTTPTVMGAMDLGASASGDFTATPLSSSGDWAAGSSSGAFTYSYGVQVPEVPGGLTPDVAFTYSSQTVDGRTSATNNQASWIGDGWDYHPGSITRQYVDCKQDAKARPGGNNAQHPTHDLCYGSNNATMTLGGQTVSLVWQSGKGWTTSSGDGSKVELLKDTGLNNGDGDGEYWRVTTRDGVQYHFGRNRLPGWKDGEEETGSVFTVPVAGNHDGEPCYKAGDFAGSFCDQAWQWNLDYVVDPSGNAMSLWWTAETNRYAKNWQFKKPVSYERGGWLRRIDYGLRADSLYTTEAPARVWFTMEERCFAEGSLACTEANFTAKDPGKYRIWYDTPVSLQCKATGDCWNAAPSFFTRKRLDKVSTSAQRKEGSDTRYTVDVYQLKQSFPTMTTGANTALWLESITRTGYGPGGASAGVSKTLNPVAFQASSEYMPNRVLRGAQDPVPGFARQRIGRVVNEYGGETVVTYSTPSGACATGDGFPDQKQNSQLCYPVAWHPDPSVDNEIDWFHKYVVTQVEELPAISGAQSTSTSYEYGTPAWQLAESEFSKKTRRTWARFAGFDTVTTITGSDDKDTSAKRSKGMTRFYRGLGTDVSVKDVTGAEIGKDHRAFAGRIAEEVDYPSATADAATGWTSRSTTELDATELARRVLGDGLDDLVAWRVTETGEHSWTKSSGAGDDTRTLRKISSSTQYDGDGLPTRIEMLGDTGVTGDESCTMTEYVSDTTKHLIGLTKQIRTSPTTCAAAAFDNLATLTEASRVAYDGASYGTAPTRGLATETWTLKGDASGFTSNGTTGYDALGRTVKATQPGQTASATITYQPSVGLPHRVTETNELGHTNVETVEPGRGTTLTTTDPNGHTSKAVYDALGRLVEAWGAGRDPTTHQVPDLQVGYELAAGEPAAVIARTRGHEDRVETSVTLYDGLGRVRQTQEPATGGGRLITDTLYNASGEVWKTNNAYFTTGEPNTTLFFPQTSGEVPNATRYTYDAMGRVLTEVPVLNGTDAPDRSTAYAYGLDHSTVINPPGTASYRTWTDGLGRTSRVDTFSNPERTAFESIRFSYDQRGRLSQARQDDGTAWSWKYDAIGRAVESTDPDTGTAKTTYDDLNRPVTSTDSRGKTVWTGYDILSRPILTRENGSGGKLLGAYSYDQAGGGVGMPYSALRYTDTGNAAQTLVSGYTSDYQPTVASTALPEDLADQYGLEDRYTYTQTYTDTGLLHSTRLPAVGTLPAEEVINRYDEEGLADSVSGHDWYGSQTVYSPYGQVLRSTLGSNPYRVWSTASYDEASGELTGLETWRQQAGETGVVTGNKVSATSYTYDGAGNITSVRQGAAGIRERQCFRYDLVGRLSEAWTSSNQDACTAGGAGSAADVSKGEDDSGYWTDYAYAGLSAERTTMVEHDLTGDTAKDTRTTYGYGAGEAGPHALTSLVREYTTEAGAKVKQTLSRVHDTAGNTTSVTSGSGDAQTLTWTYDGLPETVSGQGANGRTAYRTDGGMCLDVQSGLAVADQPLQIYSCNQSQAQKFAFVPDAPDTDANTGSLRVFGDWCANAAGSTAGSAVRIRPCAGTTAQKLTRDGTGALKHAASGLCVAVPSGSAGAGTDLVLAACSASATTQRFHAQDEARYVYAPGGARLLTLRGNEATLHLGEAEVTNNAGGSMVQVQRSYAAPGGSVMRYAYGSFTPGTSKLAALTYDHQGSVYAEVALEAGMETRIRKTDPFGAPRTGGDTAQRLQTNQGFLGASRDDSSGFTMLGARLYEPATGRFLSADPVLDLADPMQRGGYAYAHNNPVTYSDPTGLSVSLSAKEMSLALAGAGLSAAEVAQAKRDANRSMASVIASAAGSILRDFLGIDDIMACIGGSAWSCASVVLDAMPWTKALKMVGKVLSAVKKVMGAVSAWRKAKAAAKRVLSTARAAIDRAKAAKKKRIEQQKKAAQARKKKAAEQRQTTSNRASQAARNTGNGKQKTAQANAAPKVSAARSSGAGGDKSGKGGGSRGGGSSGASSRSNGGTSGGGNDSKAGGSCETNSFTTGTRVLMADGTTKPIEELEGGDTVLATDPETGETSAQEVTAEITGTGEKHLVKVTIDTDGDSGTRTATVTATDGHPFWVPELGEWIDATDLTAGAWLQTSAGTYVQITAIRRWTAQNATVHNLTVSNQHTYYVLAGAAPVLVHNCNTSYQLSLDTRAAVGSGNAQAYQIAHTGATEYRAVGGGERVWADGLDRNTGELLDAKFIEKPGRSPFIPGSGIPDFIRSKITAKMDDEFSRYAAVINDPSNPLTGLRVITNHSGAVPYFQGLMQQHGIPGSVVVR
ncbi:sugar-binding protein [Streptomyces sp. PKU-MA01144]|uniref:polymorphic toxin-type HINT domain-containing protein n=1 Tax=Streptomyces sp. PKU-MA01144 TaxID=2729138 RepID=UPI00147BFE55|nr:polymorphic toxin-type HINT domain-containing protein [Streptomyces sp. PKU-MA01144]NNJ03423.1 sugar-binding protein [Streptomyces sp. PKU-MA01144]